MPVPKYLTASDAARILGLTPGAVRLMLKRGVLPLAERTAGGIHLFLRVDVERLAAERRSRLAETSAAPRDSARRASGGR